MDIRVAFFACCDPKNRVAFERTVREKLVSSKNDYVGFLYQDHTLKKAEEMVRAKKLTTVIFDQTCSDQQIGERKGYLEKKCGKGLTFFVVARNSQVAGVETIESLSTLKVLEAA